MSSTPNRSPEERPSAPVFTSTRESSGQNLADVLERVLDKGIVVVGDIQVRLLDIELLTIKIRLMVASVDRAREMGINWWENDPFLAGIEERDQTPELEQRVRELEERLQASEVRDGR
jgi:hypothetical protein